MAFFADNISKLRLNKMFSADFPFHWCKNHDTQEWMDHSMQEWSDGLIKFNPKTLVTGAEFYVQILLLNFCIFWRNFTHVTDNLKISAVQAQDLLYSIKLFLMLINNFLYAYLRKFRFILHFPHFYWCLYYLVTNFNKFIKLCFRLEVLLFTVLTKAMNY